jgi:type I restriction enzyme S subunit
MEVKAGYKQTGIGVFPVSWEVGPLSNFWAVTDCKHVTAKFVSNGYPVASIGEVQSRFVDLKNANQTNEYFYKLLVDGGRKPRQGDLILSRNATVGKVAQVDAGHPIFAMGQDVCLLRKKLLTYQTSFLQALFNSHVITRQINDLLTGSTFKRINVRQIKNFLVPMPTVEEQESISALLGDADALIESLEQLIEKKRQIKQGVMQELLTGKRRLPGFSGEWERKRLGDVAEMGSGGTPPSSVSAYYDGDIPWASISDMTKGGKVIFSTDRNLTRLGFINSAAQMFPAGTILYAMYASIGECSIAGVSLCTSQAILGIQPKGNLYWEYLYYFLISLKSTVKKLGQQGTQANLNKGMVQAFQINLPTLPEQASIAKVLAELDAELMLLSQRKEKVLIFKKAMMQNLLTGKVRLV